MVFVNKGKIRVLRGDLRTSAVQNTQLWKGQPFYDNNSKHLFIGENDETKISDSAPIVADANNIVFYCTYLNKNLNCSIPGYKPIPNQRAFFVCNTDIPKGTTGVTLSINNGTAKNVILPTYTDRKSDDNIIIRNNLYTIFLNNNQWEIQPITTDLTWTSFNTDKSFYFASVKSGDSNILSIIAYGWKIATTQTNFFIIPTADFTIDTNSKFRIYGNDNGNGTSNNYEEGKINYTGNNKLYKNNIYAVSYFVNNSQAQFDIKNLYIDNIYNEKLNGTVRCTIYKNHNNRIRIIGRKIFEVTPDGRNVYEAEINFMTDFDVTFSYKPIIIWGVSLNLANSPDDYYCYGIEDNSSEHKKFKILIKETPTSKFYITIEFEIVGEILTT